MGTTSDFCVTLILAFCYKRRKQEVMALTEQNATTQLTDRMDSVNNSSPSVVQLTQDLIEYKIGVNLFTYMTVPVAVWGWMGNFLSFR